jgi:hypothetical protein
MDTAVHADKFDLQTESETSCFMITLMLRGTDTAVRSLAAKLLCMPLAHWVRAMPAAAAGS